MEPDQKDSHLWVSLPKELLTSYRGSDKNAHLWNLQADSLSQATLAQTLPHCKESNQSLQGNHF